MRSRRLGTTDLELTTIGLGTWAIGGPWQYGWGRQDDAASIQAIREAVRQGVNWIDTAPIYGCGHSETVVGKALEGMVKRPYVATKCGLRWDAGRNKVNCLDARSIRRECDESLKRLGIDTIDLYQLHWPDPDEQMEEAWSAMARCVQQGKARYLGACNVTAAQVDRLARIHPVAAVQPPYSLLRREIEADLIPACARRGIGMVCYSPMQKGLLTGTFTRERVETLAADDHRRSDPMFRGERFERISRLLDALRPVAERRGRTLAQLALAWVLRNPAVTAAIVGARSADQIRETGAAGDWELDAQTLAEIDACLAAGNPAGAS